MNCEHMIYLPPHAQFSHACVSFHRPSALGSLVRVDESTALKSGAFLVLRFCGSLDATLLCLLQWITLQWWN